KALFHITEELRNAYRAKCVMGSNPYAEAYDVFHATAWTVPRRKVAPLIFSCPDVTFLSHPYWHTSENKRRCIDGVDLASSNEACFVVPSLYTKNEVVSRVGIETDRINVVYQGASRIFTPQPGVPDPPVPWQRFVLSVSTFEPRKNHRGLVLAFRQVA